MSITVCMLMLSMLVGVMVVVSNSSPYFGALGLVIFGCSGCGLVSMSGMSFLALVLFLIYLGGMLVVFAYTSALASDPYPEAWEVSRVGSGVLTYIVGAAGGMLVFWGLNIIGVVEKEGALFLEVHMISKELRGVALLYSDGGGVLVLTAWVMLMMLFVVLELTRGGSRGAIRGV
uniref:NADH-ubiquinone oxidoreductase chain 6 n=1 Tax=Priolepis cincta TaxID=166757 RepID=A0A5K7TNK0_9GOBI|nr:NADH dehydrogenase subunit 6 [Priolepis cincta]